MLLFIVFSNLICLFLPSLISAHVTNPETPVHIDVKLLSSPLKNLLHKRQTILFAGAPDASNTLALNSTNGQVTETISFDETISINVPEFKGIVYFIVC